MHRCWWFLKACLKSYSMAINGAYLMIQLMTPDTPLKSLFHNAFFCEYVGRFLFFPSRRQESNVHASQVPPQCDGLGVACLCCVRTAMTLLGTQEQQPGIQKHVETLELRWGSNTPGSGTHRRDRERQGLALLMLTYCWNFNALVCAELRLLYFKLGSHELTGSNKTIYHTTFYPH